MNKKSLFHISKRDTLPWYTNVAIRGGAIILALVVCALVTTILTGENPLSIYGTILKGAFGTARKSWTTWENVAILLGISLAVTPAFKMRFWNIGAEGQVLIGCLASTTCMICLGGKMPNWLLLEVMTVASLAAGALWGFLPGFFKAKWNTNETLFLGILLHGDLRRYVDAISDAAGGAAGVLLQFPFYAGIMGMMVAANAEGVSLAGVISEFFVNISNNVTFPMLSFLAAGVVNFFVPSGGGQWAVQGPIMMPAGAAMGIENGRTAMAIAWGDQWTNMIQPFWALPALGIAKLSARDIMGYLVIVTLFVGVVACLGFLAWAAWF